MDRRRVYKAAYQPMTLLGVDRRLLFLSAMMGAAVFNVFQAFLGGILTGLCLWFVAWRMHRADPRLIDILIAARGQRRAYDAGKSDEECPARW